jgi:hypothetical protein
VLCVKETLNLTFYLKYSRFQKVMSNNFEVLAFVSLFLSQFNIIVQSQSK